MYSSVHFIYHDPSDLGSLILIRMFPKERTLNPLFTDTPLYGHLVITDSTLIYFITGDRKS